MPESQSERQRRWNFWQNQVAPYRKFTLEVAGSPAEQEPESVAVDFTGGFHPAGPLPPIPDPSVPQTPWGLMGIAMRVIGNDPRPPKAVVDSSVLLGTQRRRVVAACHLYYVRGYWSTWIVAEFTRKRTEWITKRAVKEHCDVDETVRRLADSRARINALLAELSHDLRSADYHEAPKELDLSWLADQDDHPVMQTTLAASADFLVTENKRDFPLGEVRNGVWIVSSASFLEWLYRTYPDSEGDISGYLGE